ncbi:carboxylesterase 4 variant 1, partial [Danaus plexippus plexippus]
MITVVEEFLDDLR